MSRQIRISRRFLAALAPVLLAGAALPARAATPAPPKPAPVVTRDWPIDDWLTKFSPPGDKAWRRSEKEGEAFSDSLLRVARASGDRTFLAAVHVWRGRKYANYFRLAEGQADLDSAWAISKALRDSAGLVRVLAARTHGYALLGKDTECRLNANRLVAMAGPAGLPGMRGFGHRSLGFLDKEAGNFAEAKRHLRAAIRLIPAERFENLHSRFLLAEVINRTGQHDEARAQFLQLLEDGRNRGEPFIVASCLNDLGNLEYEGGDMGKADGYWDYAAAVYDSTRNLASALASRTNRAHALRNLGRVAEARTLLDRLLKDCEKVEDPTPRFAAYGEMALLYHRLGRVAQAESLFRRVIAAGADDAVRYESAHIDLAAMLCEAGRPREGEAVLDSLLTPAMMAHMTPGNISIAWSVRSGCRRTQGRAREALAEARTSAARLRKERETSTYSLDAALELAYCYRDLRMADSTVVVLRRAARDWERWRANISDLEWRERSGSGLARLFTDYGLALLDEGRGLPRARRTREAFEALQAFQARTLEERMHGLGLAGQAMRSRVSADSLRRGVLREGELLVDIVASPDTCIAFLVTRQGVDFRLLPGTDRLERLFASWRDATLSGADHAVVEAGLKRLSDVLLAPLAEPLRGRRRVILAGGGPLALWPLAALTPPGESAALGETRELFTVPSATLLAALRGRAASPPARPLLALGRTTDAGGRDLPGAERELKSLGADYAGAEVRVHRGDRSVAELTGDLARWNVLHFAADAEARPGNPWRSGLLLGRGSGDDAYLRASKVAGMKLGAQLAVLSGCQSAGATTLAGEGALGLAGAFLCAGTASVVATLWPVEDRVAQRFTNEFYDQLARGQTVAGAVGAAQRELRSRPETSQVRDWAAFMASGEAGTRVRISRRTGLTRAGGDRPTP